MRGEKMPLVFARSVALRWARVGRVPGATRTVKDRAQLTVESAGLKMVARCVA